MFKNNDGQQTYEVIKEELTQNKSQNNDVVKVTVHDCFSNDYKAFMSSSSDQDRESEYTYVSVSKMSGNGTNSESRRCINPPISKPDGNTMFHQDNELMVIKRRVSN